VTQRHHYSVTARSPQGEQEEWFHTFAEAEARHGQQVSTASGEGATVTDRGYWRTEIRSAAGEVTEVRLDDAGLRTCGSLCGAG